MSMTNAAQIEALAKLNKDIKTAATVLTPQEARYLVDTFYQLQDYRKMFDNQCRQLTTTPEGEPCGTLAFFGANFATLEKNVQTVLETYAKSQPIGQWMMSIMGIGPIIAAGIMAHVDIKKVQTAGEIHAFAGVDPNRPWLGKDKAKTLINRLWDKYDFKKPNLGTLVKFDPDNENPEGSESLQFNDKELMFFTELSQETGRKVDKLITMMLGNEDDITVDDESKLEDDYDPYATTNPDKPKKKKHTHKSRLMAKLAQPPWNTRLKVLTWKIGQSFVKVSNNPKDYYGKIYQAKKAYYIAKNEALDYADQAKHKLATVKIGKNTQTYKCYLSGKLPPSHIDQRAQRYAAKMFLSHMFQVWYEYEHGTPAPLPYPIAVLGNHIHLNEVPNWPFSRPQQTVAGPGPKDND